MSIKDTNIDNIITSSLVTADYIYNNINNKKKVLMIGNKALKNELELKGLDVITIDNDNNSFDEKAFLSGIL